MTDPAIQAVLDFWFGEIDPVAQFKRDDAVDAEIRARFGGLHARLSEEGTGGWRETPEGCLAAIIVLDQFSRNLYRDDSRAFANDATALALAKHAVERGYDAYLTDDQRKFLYMPFQHSEDPADQARSVELYKDFDAETLDFVRRHKEIVDRFGRFPHRNAALGRESTPEEETFLKEPGSSF